MSVDNNSYSKTIELCNKELNKRINKKELWDDDETVSQLFDILYTAYWQEIHKVLVPMQNTCAENKIRGYIRTIISDHLQPLYGKIERLNRICRRDKTKSKLLNKYLELYDNYYALASFRSIKHFALYTEFDKDLKDKVWENYMPCFEGLYFYANKMVLDGSVKRIVKQYPVGVGKSYSDIIIIGFIFGYDLQADVLKVVGNPTLVTDVLVGITNLMASARFAKVFPYYAQFEGDKEKIFDICRVQQGTLVIHGSKRPKSMLCCAKETAIDGGRFKYRFYDDICRSKDKENILEHDKDWARYNDCWKKREYDEFNSFEIAGGTAYSIYDFLSRYKEKYGAKTAETTRFKYTIHNNDTKFVSIACPKLDYDTDESNFPMRFSTADAREERARDERTFMAMEQQTPLPPEGTPFYWDNLRLYSDLPKKYMDGGNRSDNSWASMDLPRKGTNYLACGIFSRAENGDFFLVDCVYQKKPLDAKVGNEELLDLVCQKLVFHKVSNIVVETNTNSTIASDIKKRLAKLNWFCNIIPKYSYENKEVRIFNTQSAILEKIIFPERKLFAESSDIGVLMRHIACYAYDGKNDDGIDMVSMFTSAFINNGVKLGSITLLETKR